MRRKNFVMGVGYYYFSINSGIQNILIKRKDKKEAARAFLNYKKLGKDVDWLGCWEGKKFSETETPMEQAA